MTRGLGQWQAYCEAGASHEERKARLEEVPAAWQPQVLIHLRTVAALKRKASEKRNR